MDTAVFEFRMDNLTALLRKQAEKNPAASYFNVDILKYQVLNTTIIMSPLAAIPQVNDSFSIRYFAAIFTLPHCPEYPDVSVVSRHALLNVNVLFQL